MEAFWIVYVFVIGTLFGSFANVVIYRLPQGKSIVKPPSACPFCGKRLAAKELIPILSWMAQRGRCRSCDKFISKRYPLVEFLCGVLFAAMVVYSPTLSVIPLFVLTFVLLTVSFIDWDTQEIPDRLLLLGVIAAFVWVRFPETHHWVEAMLGAAAGALPLLIIDRLVMLVVKRDGFGYGDVKLMAVIGLFLGWQLTLVAFFFAFVSGGIFATFLIATDRAKRGGYMAFGPFLCIGALGALWFGEVFIGLLF